MQTGNSPQAPDQTTQPTFGQQRVRVDFNPSNFPAVDKVKFDTAALIDFLANQPFTGFFNDVSLKQDGEKVRLASKAIDLYEEACMWAVKALTA